MLTALLLINALGMILIPLLAGLLFQRKFKLPYRLFWLGGAAFVASQVIHLPLVQALSATFLSWGVIPYALILGLLAGLFEETARYILFTWILKRERSWQEGVFVGLGHGGIEAVIFGFLAGLTVVNMIAIRNVDLATLPGIPPEQLDAARQQVAAFWNTPLHLALLGLVERVLTIVVHVSLSVMVLLGLASKKPVWFVLAVLWHTAVDAVAVYLVMNKVDSLAIEGVIALFSLASLALIFWLRPQFPQPESDN